jgi:hypothetical protein
MTSFALGIIRDALEIIRDAPGIASNWLGMARRGLDAAPSSFVCFPEEDTMTREEFEERLRALEAQLQAEVALIHAAHEARVRSLKSLWQAATAGDRKAVIPPAQPAPSAAPKKKARPPGAAFDELCAALPRLPEVFDKRDIARVLGYNPPYTTLVRALQYLKDSGAIADTDGYGYRSEYRKVSGAGGEGGDPEKA